MTLIRVSVFWLLLLMSISCTPDRDERPNILLIIADDLGYTDMGAYGSEIPTPTLDGLANAGVRLTNFHTGQACQQTRSMLMSGRGSESVVQIMPLRADGERANALRADIATIPELLRDAGYRTYMSGKWDLGLTPAASPQARGFDRSFALLEASSSHFAEYFWDDRSYYQEDDRSLRLEDLPSDFYSTKTYTDKMLEYLRDHESTAPWFGYLTYTAPHWPLQVPDEWLDRHAGKYDAGYDVLRSERVQRAIASDVIPEGASLEEFRPMAAPWASLTPELQRRYSRAQEIYASMIEYLDLQVGRVIDYLEETDQLNNTVIVFMSDHGASAAEIGILDGPTDMAPHFDVLVGQRDNRLENLGRIASFVDHGRGFGEAASAPLKYYKGTLAEGGIRAAAFVHYPGGIDQPAVNDTFVTVMDFLPTFLEIAGTEHPGPGPYKGRQIQSVTGRSLWPHLTGATSSVHGSDNAAGWSAGTIGAIIKGQYKLTNQPPPGTDPGDDRPAWRLYDLEIDPGEVNNIAARHPDVVDALEQEWDRNWR